SSLEKNSSIMRSLVLDIMSLHGLLRFLGLKWHEPMNHVNRGFFIFGWPHSSAAMREKDTGSQYAVDSWFEDNGKRPHIIPLSQWRSGWSPE
ncbi:MAG: hypothetical protein KZQ70_12275, partial [gamma proteobacterium symbiont of Lucinoma myriamae]|nr:hypothetical protein [gamma proteobacterium symbiont of Lucinoma myriamae]MCU7817887.1 hypothetical protein [gamma proteobacterium symbiont of Lucinoma myriamae]MCU7833170.1 hypothetical protein [gamma proteobacterium symbiont of Lucinoma myriamae]